MCTKIELLNRLENVLHRFPKIFDARLIEGLERLSVNAPKCFITNRSSSHLLLLQITQLFLQKKIESALAKKEHSFFSRLFRQKNCLCVMICSPVSEGEYVIGKDYLLTTIQQLAPGIQQIEGSFFRWFHPELPYSCLYLEVHKLRGHELSSKEIRSLKKGLEEQIAYNTPVCTLPIFWPFNEEEAYKQVQVLQRELYHANDLPQVMIHFREQSKLKLEFLVILVRPQSNIPIDQAAEQLPFSVSFFYHFSQKIDRTFPLEAWCFSLTIPSQTFYENNAINLLYARRHIAKYIEQLVGSFRDFNGGLLEKQQEKFESLKIHLADTIPDFHLFAEKVLYTLQPVEMRLSLSFSEAEKLLKIFSRAIKENGNKILSNPEGVLVIKTTNSSSLFLLIDKIKEWKDVGYAQLSLSGFHYLCVLDRKNIYISQLETLVSHPLQLPQKSSILRLIFQEGEPPSLNPHYVFGDTRCRVLSKLLFEGLTRIDIQGKPQPAAAKKIICSQDGLTYTFKLRPFFWSNGEKVTAFHFLNSWRIMLQDPNFANCAKHHFVIKNAQKFVKKKCSLEELGVSTFDAETLVIHLEWPDPIFLHKLAQPMFFPTMKKTQKRGWFNGPYLIQQQDSQGMLLERNPYYWDHHPSFLKQIQIKWLSDIESAYPLFQEEKIDWLGDPFCKLTPKMISQLQQEGRVQQHSITRARLVYINTQHPFLASAKIRQALSLAIDRSLIAKRISPYSIPLYTPLPTSLSLISILLSDNHPSRSKLLFEEGLREIGFSKEEFPSLILSYPNTHGCKLLAEYFKQTWDKVLGISVHIKGVEWNVFRNDIERGQYHMSICSAGSLFPDPSELLERFETIQATNILRWKHPLYQEKLQLARQIPEKRIQLLSKAEELLIEEMPFIPICSLHALFAHHPKLKGYVLDHAGCIDLRWAYFEK